MHGTRATYQSGHCRCLPCRAANAAYIAHLRQLHARSRIPLGTLVSGAEAAKRVKALLLERFTRYQLAQRMGLEQETVSLTAQDRIRLRTLLKIRRGSRILLGEDGINT